jgi:diguanylate cyclase (GGDEF)-like protein
MAKLVVALSGEPPRVFALGEHPLTVGREPENDIQVDLPDVSRRHCRIEALSHGGYRVMDLGSKNGTYLNGRPVQAMALEFEDRLRVGEATILYLDDAADPNEAVKGLEEAGFPWSTSTSNKQVTPPAVGVGPAVDPLMASRTNDVAEPEQGTWRSRRDRDADRPNTRRSNRSLMKERMLRLGLLSQNIASEHDLTRLVDTILDEFIDFTGFERGLLLLSNEDDSGRLHPVRGRNMDQQNLDDAEKRFSRGLVEEALDQKKITFRTGLGGDESFSARESVVSMGLESALCIPLPMTPVRMGQDAEKERRRAKRRERVLGVIYLDSTSPIRELDDSDLKLLEMVAAQAAIALQNAKLHHQATTDPLTQLANRGFINQVFEEELRRVKEERELLSVLLLDIDHFKRINDTLGHDTGDEVLRRVAGRIRRTIRRDDYAGRWGGEEFVVVLPGEGLEGARIVAQKVCDAIKSRPISEAEVTVTVSCGVAVFPEHGDTSGELIKHADQALYAAKAAGRDRVVSFTSELDRANHRTDPFGGLFDSDTARTHRNLGAVFDTIDVLRSNRPPKEILERALDNVCDLTRARRALIVVEAPSGQLRVAAGRVRGGRPLDGEEYSQSAVRTALRESRSLCVLDSTDERAKRLMSSSIDKLGLNTVMCVPLLVGERALGVLYADDATSHREFTQADLSHLEVMANQLALSLMANPRLQSLIAGLPNHAEETRNLKDEVARLRAEVERLKAQGHELP